MADRERRIQEIAYLLWEGEGRPDGHAERFWHMAEAAYEAEAEMTGDGADETSETRAATALADVSEVEAAAPAPRLSPALAPKKSAPAAKAKAAKAEPEKPAAAKANGGATVASAPKAEPAPAKAAAKPRTNAARFK